MIENKSYELSFIYINKSTSILDYDFFVDFLLLWETFTYIEDIKNS